MQPKRVAALNLLHKKLGIDESFIIRPNLSFKTLGSSSKYCPEQKGF